MGESTWVVLAVVGYVVCGLGSYRLCARWFREDERRLWRKELDDDDYVFTALWVGFSSVVWPVGLPVIWFVCAAHNPRRWPILVRIGKWGEDNDIRETPESLAEAAVDEILKGRRHD